MLLTLMCWIVKYVYLCKTFLFRKFISAIWGYKWTSTAWIEKATPSSKYWKWILKYVLWETCQCCDVSDSQILQRWAILLIYSDSCEVIDSKASTWDRVWFYQCEGWNKVLSWEVDLEMSAIKPRLVYLLLFWCFKILEGKKKEEQHKSYSFQVTYPQAFI